MKNRTISKKMGIQDPQERGSFSTEATFPRSHFVDLLFLVLVSITRYVLLVPGTVFF